MLTQKVAPLFVAVLSLAHMTGKVAADAKFSKISKIELRPYFHRQFKQPVFAAPYPGQLKNCPDAYAIVEKPGVIRLESPEKKCNLVLADLRNRVADPTLEEGLLGLAFAPDFHSSGSYYVYYSAAAPRRTIVARLDMKGKAGLGSNRVTELLTIRQPFSNHNGGMLEFGPDGYLYIGVGDGGSGGDPRGHAQNTASLLGKILRINPSAGSTSSPAETLRYKIPTDNPFAKSSGERGKPQREIFAWGLRNPWRFSFTPEGELIVGDVGQNDYEEISIVGRGDNMGWNITEGYHCFKPKKNCNKTNLREPIYEYDHGVGQSILGGYVYTGSALSQYKNKYIFADSISGRIFALDYRTRGARAELLIQAPGLWSSFGRLRNGELVISELQSGKIFLLSPTGQVGSL
ncbi:MAG: PQQ-dependent sugar dehydrogenase [Spirochaetes bacterium]|nr:PQQ-dependent sugar dehydrogenase [Spirochaetota bacterium]